MDGGVVVNFNCDGLQLKFAMVTDVLLLVGGGWLLADRK